MKSSTVFRRLWLVLVVWLWQTSDHYYVNGSFLDGSWFPRRNVYRAGDRVTLFTNKLTSEHSPFPLDYRSLPFCQSESHDNLESMNIGEWLQGDRIAASPYKLDFKRDMYCEQLCVTNLGRDERNGASPNRMVQYVHMDYHHNWILDNLPSASKSEDEVYMTTVFSQGFPMGVTDSAFRDPKAYIHNHFNIEVSYAKDERQADGYNIVQFVVEPFSIEHKFK